MGKNPEMYYGHPLVKELSTSKAFEVLIKHFTFVKTLYIVEFGTEGKRMAFKTVFI